MEFAFFRNTVTPKPEIRNICLALIILFILCTLSFSCSGCRSSGPYYYDPAKDKSAQEKSAPPASPPARKKYYYDPT